MTIAFRVHGVAQAKGNMKAFRMGAHARLTDANKNLKSWQTMIASAASIEIQKLAAHDRAMEAGAVAMSIAFYLPRPQSLKASIRAHIRKPDIDKCTRAVLDALEGVVYFADAQVVNLVVAKRYARPTESPHVDIRIEPAVGVYPLAHDQPLFAVVK